MGSFLRQHKSATAFSVALHVVIGVSLVFGEIRFSSRSRATPQPAPIQAVLVDERAVREQIQQLEARERAEIERQQEEERRAREEAEAARLEREREQERLAALQRERELAEREAEERARQVELQRQQEEAERERLAELQRQREEEERRQAEAERQRREEEERLARERAAEEERQRLAAEAEARKQRELEEQLLVALAAEEEARRAEDAGLLDQYIRNIQNQIEQRWIRPPTARAGLECIVNVTQIPSGDVTSVSIGRCNGDEAVVRSIEAAVLRASPLPRPPVPSLFQRNLVITFRPED